MLVKELGPEESREQAGYQIVQQAIGGADGPGIRRVAHDIASADDPAAMARRISEQAGRTVVSRDRTAGTEPAAHRRGAAHRSGAARPAVIAAPFSRDAAGMTGIATFPSPS